MKYLALLFLLITISSNAQDYWQQNVNYKIQVQLDDKTHTLKAFEEFEYINNSPDELTRIYVHLWPNAYKNGETALAEQQYHSGKQTLKYTSAEKKGFIDSLDFKVNGVKANWQVDKNNIDICFIDLPEPLPSGKSIVVSTPFYVKVPSGSISRLGHIGQSYQITQWFPKPAVYDKNGWNQFPYLNQGEFYSEYGTFDVEITLPKNYVVGATGDLQTESEIAFLNDRAKQTSESINSGKDFKEFNKLAKGNAFPPSDKEFKTIRYTQSNVHDFAWFADKRYNVLKSEVELPHSRRKVTTWAMYTQNEAHLWKNASEYLNDAIHFYSLWNGDYPYNQVTAVDGTISAGGGMEYPNVTVIGASGNAHQLEVVIVHEVGHNWFYGQLGTNEREHGWMDEGMNTLNEVRYMQTKYPGNTAMSDMVLNGKFHLNDLSHHDMSDISYRMLASIGEDQPIETHSARFTPANYGVVMYQKTGLVFYYLKDYLGEELFDRCMQAYYEEWEFKHPQPEDMRKSLEATSGKDLSWLFEDLIQTTNHLDYKISSAKGGLSGYDVKIRNKGQVDGPIEVNGLAGDSIVETVWIEPGRKTNRIHLNNSLIDQIRIDVGRDIPEMNRQNNIWSKEKLFKRFEPIKFEILSGDDEAEFTNVHWLPMVAGNHYDKFMLGVTVHNYGIPFKKFNYLIAPFYSFGREAVSGISEFAFNSYPKNHLKLSRIGLSVKSFKHDDSYRANESYYVTIAPYWTAKIGNRKDSKPYSQTVRVQSLYRKDRYGPAHIEHAGAYAEYAFNYSHPDHKFEFKLRNDFITNINNDDQMARLYAESTYKFRYLRNKMKRWVEIRAFIGQQYMRDFDPDVTGYQYSMSLAGTSGKQDLFVDEYYFGRNEIGGIWSQQRSENMGGFKSTSYYGTSSIAMASTNVYAQLPIKPGIFGVFADFGTFHNGLRLNHAINTGVGVRFGDIFGVYFPVWMSHELNKSFEGLNYVQKIRFTLKLNLINKPMNISDLIG